MFGEWIQGLFDHLLEDSAGGPQPSKPASTPLVRKVHADGHGAVWACYAETGGQCFKPDGVFCPCDGWATFLKNWQAVGEEIADDPEAQAASIRARYGPPPTARCLADLLEVCIDVAWSEGQITDGEQVRALEWLDVWRNNRGVR